MAQNKKALIITYYWPPSGGSPVLRWLKFVKYLSEFGWDPVIYTPSNPVPQAYDDSLKDEIPKGIQTITQMVREPANGFGFKSSKKRYTQATAFISKKGKQSLISNLAVWVRGNFFIPDARMLWIKPSVKKLHKYLVDHPVDVIISTGPPHSMHLIALSLKKKLKIPWLADFRDPWTNIDFYPLLKLMKRADRKHHILEKEVIINADAVITIGPTMTKEFEEMGSSKVHTITNGFDMIRENIKIPYPDKFSLLHVGSMPLSRNPKILWQILNSLSGEIPGFKSDLRINLIGKVDQSIIHDIDNQGLSENLYREDHISNAEAIREMKHSALLLLVINDSPNAKGILTNKFFEYMSAARPIIALGPTDGDAAEILEQTNSGQIVHYKDSDKLKSIIKDYYLKFRENKLVVDSKSIDNYSRKNLTFKLAEILNTISK